MSQTWTDDVYALNHTGTTDLQNMENNFTCLKGLFSGSSAPSNNVAGMPWFDTSEKVLKIRNSANSAWKGVMYGNNGTIMWMYENAVSDGWVLYSSVTDKVLAVKGGSYYTTGGATTGSWTQPSHTLSAAETPTHSHTGTTNSDGIHNHAFGRVTPRYGTGGGGDNSYYGNRLTGSYSNNSALTIVNSAGHTHAFTTGTIGSSNSHNHGTTYRPYAAVGILCYPHY